MFFSWHRCPLDLWWPLDLPHSTAQQRVFEEGPCGTLLAYEKYDQMGSDFSGKGSELFLDNLTGRQHQNELLQFPDRQPCKVYFRSAQVCHIGVVHYWPVS